jgi:hypothetical protein
VIGELTSLFGRDGLLVVFVELEELLSKCSHEEMVARLGEDLPENKPNRVT